MASKKIPNPRQRSRRLGRPRKRELTKIYPMIPAEVRSSAGIPVYLRVHRRTLKEIEHVLIDVPFSLVKPIWLPRGLVNTHLKMSRYRFEKVSQKQRIGGQDFGVVKLSAIVKFYTGHRTHATRIKFRDKILNSLAPSPFFTTRKEIKVMGAPHIHYEYYFLRRQAYLMCAALNDCLECGYTTFPVKTLLKYREVLWGPYMRSAEYAVKRKDRGDSDLWFRKRKVNVRAYGFRVEDTREKISVSSR